MYSNICLCFTLPISRPWYFILCFYMFSLFESIINTFLYIHYVSPGTHSLCINYVRMYYNNQIHKSVSAVRVSRGMYRVVFVCKSVLIVDIYQLWDLAAVQVPALYPNCILLKVGVIPSLAVRESRTFCRSSRLPAFMIWNTYHASCIIWKCFAKISLNSYYTRLYSDTCIHFNNAARPWGRLAPRGARWVLGALGPFRLGCFFFFPPPPPPGVWVAEKCNVSSHIYINI